MTNDEIEALAARVWSAGGTYIGPGIAQLAEFAALVTAKEREACAELAARTVCDMHIPTGIKIYGTRAAAAIRARNTQHASEQEAPQSLPTQTRAHEHDGDRR